MRNWDVIWKLYFFDFVYSGIIRGFIPTSLGNVVYFSRAVIIIVYLVYFLKSKQRVIFSDFYFMVIAFLLVGYQSIFYLVDQIDLVTFSYGIFLYVVPLIGLVCVSAINPLGIIMSLRNVILISIPVNLLVEILQTVFRFENLYSAGFGAGLVSSDGIQRATGTMSSAAGFAIYMSFCLGLLLSLEILSPRGVPKIYWIMLFVMLGLSGSRSTLLNFVFVIAFSFVLGERSVRLRSKILKLLVLAIPTIGLLAVFPISSGVLKAGISRFTGANEIDPPIQRILGQIWVKNMEWNPIGSGLGAHSRGTVLNSDLRVTFANWVEFDNARILAESGFILFLLVISVKIIIIFRGFGIIKTKGTCNRGVKLSLFLSCLPWIVSGQIFGQSSIASGTFFLVYLLLGFSRLDETNVHDVGAY
jgi:hypothetical protein